MSRLKILVLSLICLSVIPSITTDDIPQEEDFVFVLTEKNFDNFIENNQFTIVFFYAPWCGHCTQMKPSYHEAAKLLREDDKYKSDIPIVFGKVDATLEKDLASRYDIAGYPTLLIFRKYQGQTHKYEYEGPRDPAESIATFLAKEAKASWKPVVSRVVVLSLTNFTEWVHTQDLSLVEFYAPGCGHCKQLAPNYEKAAQALHELAKPIPLAKVDASQEMELSSKYHVSGYPTLYVFRKGRYYEYRGGRESSEIVSYMMKARDSGSKEVKTVKAFTSRVLKPTEFYILGLFEDNKNSLFEVYGDLSSRYSEDFNFFHSFETSEFLKHLKLDKTSVPSIIVYYNDLVITKNEPKFRVLQKEDATMKDLEEFLFKTGLPLIGHINKKNKILIYDKIKPICYVFYDIDEELRSHLVLLRDKVASVAKQFKEIQFVLANQTDNYDLIRSVYLEASESETSIVCIDEKSKLYILDEEADSFDEGEVKKFVSKFKAGKLKPYIKSEPVPKKNKKAVKIAVGKTIDSILDTPDQEIVIAFVAQERFGDLEAFEVNYEKVASELASKKNVVFYKINAFKNDFPDMFKPSLRQPSVYYIGSNAKANPVLCESSDKDWYSVASLKKFVVDNLKYTERTKKEKNNEL